LQAPGVKGVCIERRFARADPASDAPVQKFPETDRNQLRVIAAERRPHEQTAALIKPIVVAGVAR
jgi:ribosomal 50S subunit-associated protein YjgA (DUF615 family)